MKINIKKLRELNFGELISVGTDPMAYSFDEYRDNRYEHKAINGYCVSCEEKGCSSSKDDPLYKLTNMSHGAHSCDFFQALNEIPDTTDWHQEPIMFVYETPSKDYGIYKEVLYNGYNKRPSKDWYWIHRDCDDITFPEGFNRQEYGLGWSAALTFKLAKVYMTNLVKCGLNNAEGNYQGIASFKYETVENCFTNFLKKEISLINPKIIFAVGAKSESWVNYFVRDHFDKKSFLVQQLPHPACDPLPVLDPRTV